MSNHLSGDGIHFWIVSCGWHSLTSELNSCWCHSGPYLLIVYAARVNDAVWLFSTNQSHSSIHMKINSFLKFKPLRNSVYRHIASMHLGNFLKNCFSQLGVGHRKRKGNNVSTWIILKDWNQSKEKPWGPLTLATEGCLHEKEPVKYSVAVTWHQECSYTGIVHKVLQNQSCFMLLFFKEIFFSIKLSLE